MPISRAVQASSASARPVSAGRNPGRHYVDGALMKTLHASVALKRRRRSCCSASIRSFPSTPMRPRAGVATNRRQLVEGGLPTGVSQTFRAIIHSRMRVGMERYAHRISGRRRSAVRAERAATPTCFSPTCLQLFRIAERLSEHAYRHTREQLRRRAGSSSPSSRVMASRSTATFWTDNSRSSLGTQERARSRNVTRPGCISPRRSCSETLDGPGTQARDAASS